MGKEYTTIRIDREAREMLGNIEATYDEDISDIIKRLCKLAKEKEN